MCVHVVALKLLYRGISLYITQYSILIKGSRNRYQSVGNGWCLNNSGGRINFPGYSWSSVVVRDDGGANQCESKCSVEATCIGYMTEDHSKCDIILANDSSARNGGIVKVDQEKRNFCWRKSSGNYDIDDNILIKSEKEYSIYISNGYSTLFN